MKNIYNRIYKKDNAVRDSALSFDLNESGVGHS